MTPALAGSPGQPRPREGPDQEGPDPCFSSVSPGPPPAAPGPASPVPGLGHEMYSSQGLRLTSSLSYVPLREGFLAEEAPGTRRPLLSFLLLIRSLSLAQESGKAG